MLGARARLGSKDGPASGLERALAEGQIAHRGHGVSLSLSLSLSVERWRSAGVAVVISRLRCRESEKREREMAGGGPVVRARLPGSFPLQAIVRDLAADR